MRIAVIRHGVLVSRDLHNHFGFVLRDCQRSRFLSDIVVAFFEVRALFVFDRVRNAADICNRSRRPNIRHFTGNKAVARYRHFRLRQRRAVVRLASALARQRHRALSDRQLAFVRGDIVVAFFELFAFRVGDRVRNGTDIRDRSRRPNIRHFTGNKALVFTSACGHFFLRQRGAVVDLLSVGRGQRHAARVDLQRSFVFRDDVVDIFVVRALIKEDRVRHFTIGNVLHAALCHDTQHFAVSKVVARYRHVGLLQRRAVVCLASALARQRHIALVDRQRTRIRLRNDILFCRVNLVQRITRFSFILFKLDRIISSILSRCARHGNAFKGNVFRLNGKAGNGKVGNGEAGRGMIVSIIKQHLALRRQRDVLIIVEIDLVRSLGDRDRLHCLRFRRNCVAVNRVVGYQHGIAEIRIVCFGVFNLFRCSVQIIVYRVGVLFIVERQRSILLCKRNFLYLILRITFYIITEGIEAIFQGIRSLNPNFFSLVHFTCYSFSSTDFLAVSHIDVSNDIG